VFVYLYIYISICIYNADSGTTVDARGVGEHPRFRDEFAQAELFARDAPCRYLIIGGIPGFSSRCFLLPVIRSARDTWRRADLLKYTGIKCLPIILSNHVVDEVEVFLFPNFGQVPPPRWLPRNSLRNFERCAESVEKAQPLFFRMFFRVASLPLTRGRLYLVGHAGQRMSELAPR